MKNTLLVSWRNNLMDERKEKAFTLIELLIVVAIIAILAAIAVPNFLEAQVRSKTSRSKTDMRTITTAMEAYRTDNNGYPPYSAGMAHRRLNYLTTPIAYISSVASDPFADSVADQVTWTWHLDCYIYAPISSWGWLLPTYAAAQRRGSVWFLAGRGPNRRHDAYYELVSGTLSNTTYDATNGTVSFGDIERFGP